MTLLGARVKSWLGLEKVCYSKVVAWMFCRCRTISARANACESSQSTNEFPRNKTDGYRSAQSRRISVIVVAYVHAEVLIAIVEHRKRASHPALPQFLQALRERLELALRVKVFEAFCRRDIAGNPVFAALPWNLT
jgi:hypothetical protein